jgi:uncharacterized coiled-coil protein SlyX
MGKKWITGLAVSVGAGLAVTTAAMRARKKARTPGSVDGTMTPINIRTHNLVEIPRPQATVTAMPPAGGAVASLPPEYSAEMAEVRVRLNTLDERSNELATTINQRVDDLQSHLPRFIDVKVTSRIRETEDRLRMEIRDEQARTVDAFLQTLDQKLLPRIAMLEETVGMQRAEIAQLKQCIEKTDEMLQRLLGRMENTGVAVGSSPVNGYPGPHHNQHHRNKAVA